MNNIDEEEDDIDEDDIEEDDDGWSNRADYGSIEINVGMMDLYIYPVIIIHFM